MNGFSLGLEDFFSSRVVQLQHDPHGGQMRRELQDFSSALGWRRLPGPA